MFHWSFFMAAGQAHLDQAFLNLDDHFQQGRFYPDNAVRSLIGYLYQPENEFPNQVANWLNGSFPNDPGMSRYRRLLYNFPQQAGHLLVLGHFNALLQGRGFHSIDVPVEMQVPVAVLQEDVLPLQPFV
jgi:hypothetical protein